MLSVEDFASKLLRELFRLYPMERVRHLMTHFRIVPTISTNPITNGIDVSFQPVMNSIVLLEDAMALMEKVSTEEKRLVVVFDEFQDILNIRKGLDKQLRSIMLSLSKGINPLQNRKMSTSTSYSSIKRLMKAGYVIRTNEFEIEDPFFKKWITRL